MSATADIWNCHVETSAVAQVSTLCVIIETAGFAQGQGPQCRHFCWWVAWSHWLRFLVSFLNRLIYHISTKKSSFAWGSKSHQDYCGNDCGVDDCVGVHQIEWYPVFPSDITATHELGTSNKWDKVITPRTSDIYQGHAWAQIWNVCV